MGAGSVSAQNLDEFIAKVDALGGIASPEALAYMADFKFQYGTVIDESLDPFGEEYFRQQCALYSEVSGRSIDQETGEIYQIDVDYHAGGINPYRTSDLAFMTRHVRAVATAMMIAQLPPEAEVLDVGSGWGLSSEIIAYCGGKVTSVDISPLFVDLVDRRSRRLGLPITATQGNFDHFNVGGQFDAAFFYECLHHALRPWIVVENVGRHLKPGGKIIFAGEPIFDQWCNWGIRLDAVSVYCIRKFGWFESGWSKSFIKSAFNKAGFDLDLVPFLGLENGDVGIAHRTDERADFNLTATAPGKALEMIAWQSRALSGAKRFAHTLFTCLHLLKLTLAR
jgi:SAM-dependent methyltransferase